jgi:hypothetical protein
VSTPLLDPTTEMILAGLQAVVEMSVSFGEIDRAIEFQHIPEIRQRIHELCEAARAEERERVAKLGAQAVSEIIGKQEGREEGWGMWYDLIAAAAIRTPTNQKD